MIDIAVITAPRLKPTVGRMLQGFKYLPSRPDKIHVFAEPDTHFIEHPFIEVHQNSEKMGCFKNFDQAYEYLINNGDSKYILVLSDDMKYKSGWIKKAVAIADGLTKFGYVALYTPKGLKWAFENNPQNEVIKLNRGWGKGGWGGLYLMTRESAKKILSHKFYQDHKENYRENQQFDECIKETCFQLELDQYYINPSLFDHVGETSTIGHEHRSMDKGLNYERS